MKILFEKLLTGAKSLGINIDDETLDKFEVYTNELLRWNKIMNLTAITDLSEIALKHYVDSLALVKYVDMEAGAAVVDVGCGAGFPGFPLKIIRPDLKLTCIDSLAKRINFLSETAEKLNFENCICIHSRAEEAGRKAEYRENFDFSFARAVAKLRVLAEYCLPLVKVGGEFVAMKAANSEGEIDEAKNAIKELGGKIESVEEYTLPDSDIMRTIIIVKKVVKTPQNLPRPAAKISKKPL